MTSEDCTASRRIAELEEIKRGLLQRIVDLEKENAFLLNYYPLMRRLNIASRHNLEQKYQRLQTTLVRGLRHEQRQGIAAGALMLTDINCFKNINDTYGHSAGNMVLEAVAKVLLNKSRLEDTVFWLHGDEGGCLFTGLNPANVSKRFKNAGNGFDLSVTALYENTSIPASVSAGIAAIRPGEPFEQLLRRADKALYYAKTFKPEYPQGYLAVYEELPTG